MTTISTLRAEAKRLAALALKEVDYNKKRSALQKAVAPIFNAGINDYERRRIVSWSEFIKDGLISIGTSALSNFTQRLHPDVCVWIINNCEDPNWMVPIRASMLHKNEARFNRGARNFGYPGDHLIKSTDIQKAYDSMSTIEITSVPVSKIIDVIDTLVTAGSTDTAIYEVMIKTWPEQKTSIESFKAMRDLRGARTMAMDPFDAPTQALHDLIHAALTGAAAEAEPDTFGGKEEAAPLPAMPTITIPDDRTVSIVDGVMSSLGLPSIKDILSQANAAASLTTEVERLRKSPPRVIEKVMDFAVAAGGTLPAGKVTMKNAADVFEITDPKRRKLFDFDVPTGEWDGPHPYIPEKDDEYLFNPKTMLSLLLAIRDNSRPWLRGHTGTGKTTMVEQTYARLNLPVYRVNLDSDISRSELVGRDTIRQTGDGKTESVFIDGIIPRVMQEPCMLLLDEVDASRPDLGFVLQRLMEGKGFMLLEDGGRTIMPHPFFRLAATANTNGRGDETGLYTGTRVLGSAFVDRFKPFLTVDYIDTKSELKLIQAKAPTLPKAEAERIAAYAKEHRIAFTQNQVTLPCSPRLTLNLAQGMAAYIGLVGPDEARQLCFSVMVANAADADDRVVLQGIADRTILVKGTGAKPPTF